MKARYNFLNMQQLQEPVATDTYFSSVKGLDGENCAQAFFGIKSQMINVIGMTSENEGPLAYEEFLRSEGIPTLLWCDNARMQKSFDFQEINRHWLIKDGFTEPYHPQQNPAELRAVRWLKMHTELIMNRTGAPDYLWFYCAKYFNGKEFHLHTCPIACNTTT